MKGPSDRGASEDGARRSGQAYLAHWGLAEAPFLLEPDTRFAFERADHREGLARILFGLTQLGGVVLVTGDIGCGKTMLAHSLARTLGGDEFRLAAVANPPRTAAALLAALAAAFDGSARGGSTGRLATLLRDQVEAAATAGQSPVVLVDEAQRVDLRALDELRLLTNPGEGPAAPVVLLGQPELAARVARVPQLDQRVVVRYHLGPMTEAEVAAYVAHRARVAGAPRAIFSQRAAGAIHAKTGGVPRLVNLLAANALFVGYARGESIVGEDTVRDVADDHSRHREEAIAG
jgi:general secretion pathway protein A